MTNHTDPIPLSAPEYTAPVAWACGSCRVVLASEPAALAHCHCQCERCKSPVPIRDFTGLCPTCRPIVREEERAESHARLVTLDAEAFAKARKVPESAWSDTVVWEDGSGDMSGDGYFSSTDTLREQCERDGVPVPAYVWGTSPMAMILDAGHIIDQALEDSYEGANDAVSADALTELQGLLDGWCERHPVKWWSEDRGVAVMMTGRGKGVGA